MDGLPPGSGPAPEAAFPPGSGPASEATLPSGFGPATRAWLSAHFASPTPVQAQGWPLLEEGAHALLAAPTGSG